MTGKISLKRRPDWRKRLHVQLDAIRRVPFSWREQHDCGLGLVAPCVEAMTGVDLSADWRGRYSTAAGAVSTLRAAGYDDIAALLADLLVEVPVSFARVGDLVTLPGEAEGLAMGVVIGRRVAALTLMGVCTVPLLTALRAFRVG